MQISEGQPESIISIGSTSLDRLGTFRLSLVSLDDPQRKRLWVAHPFTAAI